MPVNTTDSPARTTSGPATRARILASASELFYAQGIRATSAERIIEDVGITKVTFYRHFRTKSELVVAYLEVQAAGERAWMSSALRAEDPLGSLRELATGIGAASCRPGFRGCAFINAAAEFGDENHPVRETVNEHRDWYTDTLAGLFSRLGHPLPGDAADDFILARDGAMAGGYAGDAIAASMALQRAGARILAG